MYLYELEPIPETYIFLYRQIELIHPHNQSNLQGNQVLVSVIRLRKDPAAVYP